MAGGFAAVSLAVPDPTTGQASQGAVPYLAALQAGLSVVASATETSLNQRAFSWRQKLSFACRNILCQVMAENIRKMETENLSHKLKVRRVRIFGRFSEQRARALMKGSVQLWTS